MEEKEIKLALARRQILIAIDHQLTDAQRKQYRYDLLDWQDINLDPLAPRYRSHFALFAESYRQLLRFWKSRLTESQRHVLRDYGLHIQSLKAQSVDADNREYLDQLAAELQQFLE